jgi:uncharacterized membrane protein HdeD (DUF308 family)
MKIIVVDIDNHVRRWWVPLLRGAAALLFGLVTLAAPGVSLVSLMLLFGAYAVLDGLFALVGALGRSLHEQEHFWALLLHGIVGITLGIITLFVPGITTVALVYLIASWAAVTGAFEIVTAVRMRKLIQGEWLMILTGCLAIAFGLLLALRPGSGALVLMIWIGTFALVTGILLVILSLRLRAWGRRNEPHVTIEAGSSRS